MLWTTCQMHPPQQRSTTILAQTAGDQRCNLVYTLHSATLMTLTGCTTACTRSRPPLLPKVRPDHPQTNSHAPIATGPLQLHNAPAAPAAPAAAKKATYEDDAPADEPETSPRKRHRPTLLRPSVNNNNAPAPTSSAPTRKRRAAQPDRRQQQLGPGLQLQRVVVTQPAQPAQPSQPLVEAPVDTTVGGQAPPATQQPVYSIFQRGHDAAPVQPQARPQNAQTAPLASIFLPLEERKRRAAAQRAQEASQAAAAQPRQPTPPAQVLVWLVFI